MAKRKKKQIPPTRLPIEEKHIDQENVPGWVRLTEEVVLHETEILPAGIYGRMAFIGTGPGGELNVVFRYQDVQNRELNKSWSEWLRDSNVPVPCYDIKSLRGFYMISYAPKNVELKDWFMMGGLEIPVQPPKAMKPGGVDKAFMDMLD